MVGGFRAHHPSESEAFWRFAVHIKKRWIDSQRIARHPGQAFDVKRMLAGLGIAGNVRNIIRPKNKNIAAMRPNEIVTELIDENLVAGIDRAASNDITFFVTTARRDSEILLQRIRRRIDKIAAVVADDLGKGKKERILLRDDLLDDLVLVGNNVDVVAAQNKKL